MQVLRWFLWLWFGVMKDMNRNHISDIHVYEYRSVLYRGGKIGVLPPEKNEFPLSCVYFNLDIAEGTLKVITQLKVNLQYCLPSFLQSSTQSNVIATQIYTLLSLMSGLSEVS